MSQPLRTQPAEKADCSNGEVWGRSWALNVTPHGKQTELGHWPSPLNPRNHTHVEQGTGGDSRAARSCPVKLGIFFIPPPLPLSLRRAISPRQNLLSAFSSGKAGLTPPITQSASGGRPGLPASCSLSPTPAPPRARAPASALSGATGIALGSAAVFLLVKVSCLLCTSWDSHLTSPGPTRSGATPGVSAPVNAVPAVQPVPVPSVPAAPAARPMGAGSLRGGAQGQAEGPSIHTRSLHTVSTHRSVTTGTSLTPHPTPGREHTVLFYQSPRGREREEEAETSMMREKP